MIEPERPTRPGTVALAAALALAPAGCSAQESARRSLELADCRHGR